MEQHRRIDHAIAAFHGQREREEAPPTLIENRYRVISVLGAGGMGTVYQVSDEAREGKVVALKTLNLDLSQAGILESFQREFRVLTRLRHPNLVGVYDYGVTTAGTPYYTMEYIQGEDLKSNVQRLGVEAIVPLIVQVCRALAYMYARRIMHGDLKPPNILVVGDQVKLVDFGLAGELQTAVGQPFVGTWGYMAPEVQHRQPVDHRADLYSLGAIWYELILGETPQFMLAHDHMVRASLLETAEGITPALAEVVVRLLASSPAGRYNSANAVIAAINAAAHTTYALETRETATSYALQAQFVGREAELRTLQNAWQLSQAAAGQIVLVAGPSGSGKTRLMNEFTVGAELEGTWVVRGQCVEVGSSAYQPWREVLRVLVRYVERSATVALERPGAVLATVVPELRQRPYLTHAPHPTGLAPQAEQVRLNDAIAQILRGAAAARRTVVVIEDAHWADEATLDLLSFLVRVHPIKGLLICVTYRDDEIDPGHRLAALAADRVQRVRIGSLTPESVAALVRSMLGLAHLPAVLAQRVQQATAGNAFFVQELIRSLAEDNTVLQQTVSGWRVDESTLATVSLPDSVRQVLLRRLQRLPAAEQEALQSAAVVGPTFWLSALGPGNVSAPEILQSLLDKRLIIERSSSEFPGDREYAFEHATLMEVAYDCMPAEVRKQQHMRAASWLAERNADQVLDHHAGQIAEHYERAGDMRASGEWYARAAQQAQATYAPEAAIGYYRKALDFLPESLASAERKVALYEGLGRMLWWTAHYGEAAAAYHAMLAEARKAGDEAAQARAWNGLSDAQEGLGDPRAVLESAAQAIQAARSAGAGAELAEALFGMGWAHFRLGQPRQARALGEEALAISTQMNAQREMGNSLNLLGMACDLLGQYGQAHHYKGMALAIRRESGDRRGEAATLNNLGETARLRGDYRTAVTLYQEALQIAQEIGDRHEEIVFLNNLGAARVGLGQYDAAELDLRQAIHLSEPTPWLSETYRFLAEALLEQEKTEEALAVACKALELGRQIEAREFAGSAWRVLGMIASRMRADLTIGVVVSSAAACFAESLAILTEAGATAEQARTLLVWARHETESGDRELGARIRQEARALLANLGAERSPHLEG